MTMSSESMRAASTAAIVMILFENAYLFLKKWKIHANSLSISLELPYGLIATALATIHVLQTLSCLFLCVPTTTRAQTQLAYGVLSIALFVELTLRVASSDDAAATKCALLLGACANKLLDCLCSAERRVYSGFVGDSQRFELIDSVVSRLREASTRYKVAALSQISCVAVLLYTATTAESVLRGAELRRQLGHASWSKTISLVALLSSFAVFDRSSRNRKKHL
jgi:hypothetical protein